MYSLSASQRAGLGAGEVTASTMHSGGGADPQAHFLVGLTPGNLGCLLLFTLCYLP